MSVIYMCYNMATASLQTLFILIVDLFFVSVQVSRMTAPGKPNMTTARRSKVISMF